ncbi:MAG: Xaa-Pro peptidase family protein [Thermoplasmata archaeon]
MKYEDIFKDMDALYISNPRWQESIVDLNFFYFTRLLDSGLSEGASIVLTKDQKIIITGELGEEDAKRTGFKVMVTKNETDKNEILKNIFKYKKKIGIPFSSFTVQEFNKLKDKFPNIEFIDAGPIINDLRAIKDEQEISLVRESIKIAEDSVEELLKYFKEGITEKEIASQMSILFIKNGADGNAFTPIVAFGENSAEQHHFPGPRKLKRGDFVLMDFGARYMHYNSDITRTYVFGRGNERQKKIYETVKKAQEIGIETIKNNVAGTEVQNAMRKYVDSTEFKDLCNLGATGCNLVGHGLGLAVHDHPAIPGMQLKKNMIITVEPGIYIKNYGGVRIEDDVLIKDENCEILTHLDKEYREI